jgi:hypothetical protein
VPCPCLFAWAGLALNTERRRNTGMKEYKNTKRSQIGKTNPFSLCVSLCALWQKCKTNPIPKKLSPFSGGVPRSEEGVLSSHRLWRFRTFAIFLLPFAFLQNEPNFGITHYA